MHPSQPAAREEPDSEGSPELAALGRWRVEDPHTSGLAPKATAVFGDSADALTVTTASGGFRLPWGQTSAEGFVYGGILAISDGTTRVLRLIPLDDQDVEASAAAINAAKVHPVAMRARTSTATPYAVSSRAPAPEQPTSITSHEAGPHPVATAKAAEAASASATAIVCPNGHTDRVARVSAIYKAGTADASTYVPGDSGRLVFGLRGDWAYVEGTPGRWSHGVTATRLAQDLAPPVPPAEPSPYAGRILLGILLILVAVASAINGINTFDQIQWSGVPLWLVGLSVLVVCGGMALIGVVLLNSGRLNSDRDRERYTREYAAFKRALASWGEACYCGRCDIVFAPSQTGKLVVTP